MIAYSPIESIGAGLAMKRRQFIGPVGSATPGAAASKVLHKLALMVVHDRCSVRSAGWRTSGSALSLVPLAPVMLIARRNRPSKRTSGVLSRHQVSVRREAVHI